MSRPTTLITLPFGLKPGWELEPGDEEEDKNSIIESCVLLQALRQSREKWLFSTFPKFSSKARGAKGADAPPPHTIQNRGRCDLEIGPHIFPETAFYEVHYLPPQNYPAAAYQPTSVSWQTKTPYGAYVQPTSVSNMSQPFDLERSSTPLISSLTAVTTITPTLINQVNSAASSNPTLANLLQLAAAGKATPEQLKTLGLLIQPLATADGTQVVPPTLTATPAPPPLPTTSTTTPAAMLTAPAPAPAPIKEFDLVLEFRESSSERWIFPRGLVSCERIIDSPSADATSHTIIQACLPFQHARDVSSDLIIPSNSTSISSEVVSFHLKRTPLAIWDTISRWVGGEQKMEENRLKLHTLRPVQHVYLGYQLSSGPLLSQLRMATTPTYTMKPLKTSTSATSRAKRRAKSKAEISRDPASERSGIPKRRRITQPERMSTQIQCVACENKDVPLILGGRFCRPCADAGHGKQPTLSHAIHTYLPTVTPAAPKPTPPTAVPNLDAPQPIQNR